jgi:4-amino-4-deoxy-L-arabinose transferase-like glycosyltransferase
VNQKSKIHNLTSHEARFALLARDIVERGGWFEPRVGGEVYRNKPPLYPWSIAALSLPRGRVTEATAQAPAVAAAVGAILFTLLLGAALFGARAGLWGALILLTSYEFFAYSQLLLPDMLVVVFVTAAAYFFWRAQGDPPGRGALRRSTGPWRWASSRRAPSACFRSSSRPSGSGASTAFAVSSGSGALWESGSSSE